MRRCAWDCSEIDEADRRDQLAPGGVGDPFRYLPKEVAFTSEMAAMADRYESHSIDWTFCPAFQAACFLRPESAAQHETRRRKFASLRQQVESMGFQLPTSVVVLVETDEYVDRLHHNTIWLKLPDEIWPLPAEPEKIMFLVFSEGQGCCHWHLLLAPDHTHVVVCCEEAFGCPSVWPGKVPDFSKFEVTQCADSFDEWLYYFFRESAEHDRQYLQRIDEYIDNSAGEYRPGE
jgi:hypothetical protein